MHSSCSTLPFAPRKPAGRDGEIALGALGLARGGAQLERPVRPGERLVLLLRRLRQDLELRDRDRALPERGADAVGAGVAAADHDHVLAFGQDRRDVALRLAGDAAVLLRQEVHGEMDAVEIAAGHGEIARLLGAAGEQHGVIVALELLDGEIAADVDVAMEGDAFGLHLLDAALDDVFLHLEVGDAVAQQAAGLGVLLVDMHVVAGARELLRGGEAGGTRADDRHALAGLRLRRQRRDPAFLEGLVGDGALDRS